MRRIKIRLQKKALNKKRKKYHKNGHFTQSFILNTLHMFKDKIVTERFFYIYLNRESEKR